MLNSCMKTKMSTQDKKMYRWEKNSVFPLIRISAPWALRKISAEQANLFLEKIYETLPTRPPKLFVNSTQSALPEIREGKLRAKLHIPEDYLRPVLLIHQCALILSESAELDNAFIEKYIMLLNKYIGIKTEAMKFTLKGHGIDYEQTL